MPQDPNLYGQRPPKRQRKEMDLSSSLAFTSQLTSLLSKPRSSSATTSAATTTTTTTTTNTPPAATVGRARPSKTKDIFAGVKAKKRRDGAVQRDFDAANDGDDGSGSSKNNNKRIRLRSPTGTSDSAREREAARLNMEEKARRYAAMKRGDYVPNSSGGGRTHGGRTTASDGEPLVDFDRKWAEKHLDRDSAARSSSSSSSGDDDDDEGLGENDTEEITYTDEFGRTRKGTRAEALRRERRGRAGLAAAAELEAMSARPAAPGQLLWGDAVQAGAFEAANSQAMEELAARRDRSATPPPARHYDAGGEMRGRGVGFYRFSAGDEEARRREMEALGRERAETERARREREEERARRRREVEERRRELEGRRREVGARRALKRAESFLDGLGVEIGGDCGDGGARKDGKEDGQ